MQKTSQLLLFMDVVQQGSFTKAATLHNMDNSAVSKQIKQLESNLGVQLLNRSTRSFSLTSAGEEILSEAVHLRDSLKQIQLIADSYQKEPKGILRITSPIYFGQEHLQSVISSFMKKYPNIEVVHSLNDKKVDVISDHFDIAFRLGKLSDSNLIAKKVASTHFLLIASTELVEKYGYPQSTTDLMSMPAVVYSNQDITLDRLTINREVGSTEYDTLQMNSRYKLSDVRTQIQAVQDGLGYALIDVSNLSQPLKASGLVQIMPNHKISTMETALYAIYPHRKQTKLTTAFIEAVQNHIGDPPRWQNYLGNSF